MSHPASRPGPVEVLPAVRRNDGTEALDRLQGFSLKNVEAIGNVAAKAGMFKSLSGPQAFIKVIAALELDVPLVQGLGGLDIIEGQVQMRSGLMAQLLKRSGRYRYKITRWDSEACEMTWFEKVDGQWEEAGPSSFTVEDARQADLLDKPGKPAWQKYRKDMLRNRAVAQGARAYCADALGGAVYDEDELEASPRNYEEHTELLERGRVEAPASPPASVDDGHEAGGASSAPLPSTPPAEVDPIATVLWTPAGGHLATRAQCAAFRATVKKAAPSLEAEDLARIVRWATRGETSTVEGMDENRLRALRGVFETATERSGLIPALIRRVAEWEAGASGASGDGMPAPASEGRLPNPDTHAGTAAGPTTPPEQPELL